MKLKILFLISLSFIVVVSLFSATKGKEKKEILTKSPLDEYVGREFSENIVSDGNHFAKMVHEDYAIQYITSQKKGYLFLQKYEKEEKLQGKRKYKIQSGIPLDIGKDEELLYEECQAQGKEKDLLIALVSKGEVEKLEKRTLMKAIKGWEIDLKAENILPATVPIECMVDPMLAD